MAGSGLTLAAPLNELMIAALPALAIRMWVAVRWQGSCFQSPAREGYSQVIHRKTAVSGLSGIERFQTVTLSVGERDKLRDNWGRRLRLDATRAESDGDVRILGGRALS
jgi:hypothetical protein